jgi:hypothetical protein
MRSRVLFLVPIAALLAAAGCTSIGVKPWQRDLLSREEMSPRSESLDRKLDEHVYVCKEAASGGSGFIQGEYGCP